MVAGAFKSLGAVRKSSETKLFFFLSFFLFFLGGDVYQKQLESIGAVAMVSEGVVQFQRLEI